MSKETEKIEEKCIKCVKCHHEFSEYIDSFCYIFDSNLNEITRTLCLSCINRYSEMLCKSCHVNLNEPYNRIVINNSNLFCYCCFKHNERCKLGPYLNNETHVTCPRCQYSTVLKSW